MIIDYRKDSGTAEMYDVKCTRTGESLNHLTIWYADDDAGIIKTYRTDESGRILVDRTGDPISETHRKCIRIVLKPEFRV